MNDPNKVISVNLSSLLSLKAELLRKQAEVSKAKETQISAAEYVAHKTSSDSSLHEKREKKGKSRSDNTVDNDNVHELEDTALWEKSQRILAAKSKFYNKMSRSGGNLNSDDNCLVMFNRKRQEDRNDENISTEKYNVSDDDSDSSDSENCANEDTEDDWVEFTDCLGRTRKCLRKDLEDAKRKDALLAASMPERFDQSKANWMIDTKGSNTNDLPIGPLPPESILSDGCSLISKHDEQRANWERKEIENLDKSDVHYQDVFFDEARQHGVGYYAFSTDEEERKRQQRQLEATRQRTIAAQKQRDEIRTQREKIIAERVLAAKNRQRTRLGLPPLESIEEKKNETENKETKEERKEKKRAEKLKRRQEREEKEREMERKHHIRPWDHDKSLKTGSSNAVTTSADDSNEWVYKPERLPMSQAEWNEKCRLERKSEFAPIPEEVHNKISLRANFNSMPPPPEPSLQHYNAHSATDNFQGFQSSKSERRFQKRNYTDNEPEVPTGHGISIPPPSDLIANDAFPSHTKKPKSNSELERSIEAGLRYIRNKSDKGTMSTKSSWTTKADY